MNKSTENKWADADVDYASALWEDREFVPDPFYLVYCHCHRCDTNTQATGAGVEASEVFIVPSVATGQGTRRLLEIVEKGIADVTTIARTMEHKATIAQHAYLKVRLVWFQQYINLRIQHGNVFDDDLVQERARQGFRPYEIQAMKYNHAHDLAKHIIEKFLQLQKVARSVLAEQEDKGEQITQTEQGIKKLTVGIKCVDNVWLDITRTWYRLKHLKQELDSREMLGGPSSGQAEDEHAKIEDADEDGNGNGNGLEDEQEAQLQIYRLNPNAMSVQQGLNELRFASEGSGTIESGSASVEELAEASSVAEALENGLHIDSAESEEKEEVGASQDKVAAEDKDTAQDKAAVENEF